MTSFWVQHGYGKGSKIDELRTSHAARGVILSPGDEGRDSMTATIGTLDQLEPLLDPQTYVYSIEGGTARCHDSHGLEFDQLHWSSPPQEIAGIADAVIRANDELDIQRIIAPTCLQRSFSDVWTPVAIQLARSTLAATDREVFVSLVVDESALSNWRDVATWLDIATTLDAAGFYIAVNRGRAPYLTPWDPVRFTNLLRLVYSLSVLNDYEVILGYSDLEGALSLAAGVDGHAAGWFYGLRRFSETKWQPSKGGKSATPRITLDKLVTPVRAAGEASQIAASDVGSEFLAPSVRELLAAEPAGWTLSDSWGQHLKAVSALSENLTSLSTVRDRVAAVDDLLRNGTADLQRLTNKGIVLNTQYATRLTGLRQAFTAFAKAERI